MRRDEQHGYVREFCNDPARFFDAVLIHFQLRKKPARNAADGRDRGHHHRRPAVVGAVPYAGEEDMEGTLKLKPLLD